ncbi:endopeptidase La [Candidatus Gottesmanbacteria bacterium]|nr:endopeptidase La [Candidatus Gottesmanbacteria bacterium]
MDLLPSFSSDKIIPLIPIRDGVIFPHTETVLTFGRPKSVLALEAAYASDREVVLVLQRQLDNNNPKTEDLYGFGTLSHIERMIKDEQTGNISALIKGLSRVKIKSFDAEDPYFLVKVETVLEVLEQNEEITALANHITQEFKKAVNLGKQVDFLVFMNIVSGLPPLNLSNHIASVLDVKPSEKQELLEESNVKKRLEKINELLSREVKVLEIERKISVKTQERFDKSVRETMLRERMKTIEKELGEDENKEIRELRDKMKKALMPKEVQDKCDKEIKRLEQMSPYNPEASYIRAYLDVLLELPWSISSPNNVDIKEAEKILNEDHFGLSKIKERILEYLAVYKLKRQIRITTTAPDSEVEQKKKNAQPTILCFVGPPGVGKTSIGKSIARALKRKFVKISLGGIRDEAEIRGHRRTYVGAMPGRIMQGIKQAGTKNPIFMLDEIDKVGTDFRGDPSAALLEALDPEQNFAFSDHYIEAPFDLSEVMFITTCNVLDTIPPALRDRLEIIHFAGYTEDEKFQIAKNFLMNKLIAAHGLKGSDTQITDKAIHQVINRYTREAGVRSLERELAAIMRKVAKNVVSGKKKKTKVTHLSLHKFLGPTKFSTTLAEEKNKIGISTGLAWTEAGGDVLFIEVALMPGKGNLVLTGQLGEVMQESCKAAISYVRSYYKELALAEKFYQKVDVHVHVPEGAVPKDGPSAGVAIATALVSAFTKIATKREFGMTGEITLRGRVLEIGGVKEKVIAAHRAGLKVVILPSDNQKDLEDIPKNVKKDIKFIFANHINDVLSEALVNTSKLVLKKEE